MTKIKMAIVSEDNSPLFKLNGSLKAPENPASGYQLHANEPYLCHRKCVIREKQFGPVGLQVTDTRRLWIKKEYIYIYNHNQNRTINKRERERNVLFTDALNTFYLRLYGVRHMVKDHSDSEKGNPLPPHRLLLLISSKASFICIIPQTG